jgi:hypothetical protein
LIFFIIPKFGVAGKVMDKVMLKRFMRKNMIVGMSAIEEHAQTGRIIGKDGVQVTPITAS